MAAVKESPMEMLKQAKGEEFALQVKALKGSQSLLGTLHKRDQTGSTVLMYLASGGRYEEIQTLREAMKDYPAEEQSRFFEEKTNDEMKLNAVDLARLATNNSKKERNDSESVKRYETTLGTLEDWKESTVTAGAQQIEKPEDPNIIVLGTMTENALIALFKKRVEELTKELDGIAKKGEGSVTDDDITRVNHLNLVLHREALSISSAILKDDAEKKSIKDLLKEANTKMKETGEKLNLKVSTIDPGKIDDKNIDDLVKSEGEAIGVAVGAIYEELMNFIETTHKISRDEFAIEEKEFDERQRELRAALRKFGGIAEQPIAAQGAGPTEETVMAGQLSKP